MGLELLSMGAILKNNYMGQAWILGPLEYSWNLVLLETWSIGDTGGGQGPGDMKKTLKDLCVLTPCLMSQGLA